jgi:hypothetical protein
MPRYEPDLTQVTANIEVLPKGDYEFSISEPKSFEKAKKDREGNEIPDQKSVGIRYPIKVENVLSEGLDPNLVGKRQFASVYIHNEGGMQFAKRFLMSALGYGGNSSSERAEAERAFNEAYRGRDWSVDPESGAVGDVWREAVGQRIVGSLNIQVQTMGQNVGEMQQTFDGWRTVASLAAR